MRSSTPRSSSTSAPVDFQLGLLAQLARDLAHDAVEALVQVGERHRAHAHQLLLHLAVDARLLLQRGVGVADVLLQALLDRADVVQALGHQARQLLQARVAVELQRVEVALFLVHHRQARLHLAVGLHLDLAQLAAHARYAFREVAERLLDRAQLGFDARARDRDLAGLVDQVVERVGVDAQRRRRARQRRLGPRRRRRRGCSRGLRRGRRRHRRGRDHHRDLVRPQALDVGAQAVHALLEEGEELFGELAGFQRGLDAPFHQVAELAEADRARHPRAALQRVQQATQRLMDLLVGRVGFPVAQVGADLRHDLLRLLDEDRQQLRVDVVAHHALFASVGRARRRRRHRGAARGLQARDQGTQRGLLRLRRGRRFSALDRLDHAVQTGDRGLHGLGVLRIGGLAGEAGPLLERARQIGERGEARGARGAGQRVRGAHEIRRSLGRLRRAPRLALRLEHRDVLGGFVGIDVVEAARYRHRADGHRIRLASRPGTPGELDDAARVDAALQPRPAQRGDPLRERCAGAGQKLQQRRRRGAHLLQPQVQHLLDFPGRFAQVAQADHAAAALERVEGAAHGGQGLEVIRLCAQGRQRFLDPRQHLDGLLEEHLEQLGVHARTGRRRRGRLQLLGFLQHRLRKLSRRRGPAALLVAAEKERDRLVGRLAAVAAGLEEEGHAGEAFGDPVHVIAGGALAARLRQHQALADRNRLRRRRETEHGKRAMRLPQVGLQLGERRALAGVARECVDHAFDVLQVGEHLTRHLGAHLQRADALGEVGAQAGRRLAVRLAVRGVEQPAAHDHDLHVEIVGRAAEVVDDMLDQQERRRHLDHQHLALARIRVGQLARDQGDRVEQLDQVLVAEVLGLGLELGDALAEHARACRLRRRRTVPRRASAHRGASACRTARLPAARRPFRAGPPAAPRAGTGCRAGRGA